MHLAEALVRSNHNITIVDPHEELLKMMECLGMRAMRTPPVKSGRNLVLSLPLMFMVLKAGPTIRPPPRRCAVAGSTPANKSSVSMIIRPCFIR